MKIIEGEKYYTAKEVGLLVNRTHLTVHLWDTWSNELEERGDKRLIPEPLKVGKQKTRYWKEDDIVLIKNFANNIQRGDLAEFSQRQWSKKNTSLEKDITTRKMLRTIESVNELDITDKLIYSFIFLSKKNGKSTSIKDIETCFTFGENVIVESVNRLLDLSLIIKFEDDYSVL